MRRPEIKLENYEAVYRYYRDHGQFGPTSWLGYHAMSLMMSPEVSYEVGAKDEIRDHIASGGKVIVTPNHLLNTDQYVVAAIVATERVLHPLQGITFVLSRPDILASNFIQRRGVDTMGAIPVWREKDDKDKTEAARQLRAKATAMAVETCVHRIVELGDHGALFRESTRNTGDPRQLLPFKHGASNIILAANSAGANVLALPIAVRYPDSSHKIRRHAEVRIGRLVQDPPTTAEEAALYTTANQGAVQECLNYLYPKAS